MRGDLQIVAGLLLVLVALVASSWAAHTFEVHRALQYDRARLPYGSRAAALTGLPLLSLSAATLGNNTGDNRSWRSVVVARAEELDVAAMERVAKTYAGLLVLLPSNLSEQSEALRAHWFDVERSMQAESFPAPIYFALEDSELTSIHAMLNSGSELVLSPSLLGDDYQLELAARPFTPEVITDAHSVVIQGWLEGVSEESQGEAQVRHKSLPTIALVANLDAGGVAPSMPRTGSDGSGLTALLELARIFSALYRGPRTEGRYNLLFLVTSGSQTNYAGAVEWLKVADRRLLDSIELAICLDDIGANTTELFLHVSRSPKTESIASLFKELNNTALKNGISFETVQKKINLKEPDVYWEHEQISTSSKGKVSAATISQKSVALPSFYKRSILDSRNATNEDILLRNIKFIAESLARHIFSLHGSGFNVFEESLALSTRSVHEWLDMVNSVARPTYALRTAAPLPEAVKKVLALHIQDVKALEFLLNATEWQFFKPNSATITIFRVKPYIFEIVLFFAVFAYLAALYTIMKGFTTVYNEIGLLFFNQKKRA